MCLRRITHPAGIAQAPPEAEKVPAGHMPSMAKEGKGETCSLFEDGTSQFTNPYLSWGKGERISLRSMETHPWTQFLDFFCPIAKMRQDI